MTAPGEIARARPFLDGSLLGQRHLRLMARRPSSIAGAVIFPMLFTLLFFTVFKRVMERIGIDFAQFLVPAVVVQAMFFTAMSSAVLAAEDAAGGMLTRLRALPVSRTAPFAGLIVAELARALVSLTVLIPLGLILGFRFQAGPIAAVGFVIVALAFVLTACAGYIALGLTVGNPDTAQALVMLPYFPLLLLSNALSPADRFPGWLQPIVRDQPISQVCDALRALSTEGAAVGRPLLSLAAWLTPLFVVFLALAARGFGSTR